MPFISERTGHIAWLMANLANKRSSIQKLLQRLAGFVRPASPALFAKFLRLLDEVAVAKDQEMNLMTRIENIEREHRFMRLTDRLKRAVPRPISGEYAYGTDRAKSPFRRNMLLFLLWYVTLRQKINQKKQGVTVD